MIVSVFGSSQVMQTDEDYAASEAVGRALAIAGHTIMTGGYGGVMEAASRGASLAGGHVVGVTTRQIEAIRPHSRLNRYVTEHVAYDTLAQRVNHLIKQADGYVVMPGGVGTLNELVLAWEYMRVGEIPLRPLICYGPLWRRTLTAFMDDRYLPPAHQAMVAFADSPDTVIAHLQQ